MALKLADESSAKGKKSKGKALATMKDMEAFYAKRGKQAAAAAPIGEGVKRISAKDGVFWVGDNSLPDPLQVIVVAEAHQNVWYPEAYDPESPSPPGCFAQAPVKEFDDDNNVVPGTGEEAMHAHPTSPQMQGGPHDHDCATCEMNKFGSAETGRGKACANTRQLVVVMHDDPALEGGGDLQYAILTLSATALSPWGKFVQALDKIESRPPEGAVVQFSFNKKDPVEQKRKAVIPVGYKLINDIHAATKIRALRETILETKVLLRPMSVEARETGNAKAKPGTKGKASAKPGKAKRAAARF